MAVPTTYYALAIARPGTGWWTGLDLPVCGQDRESDRGEKEEVGHGETGQDVMKRTKLGQTHCKLSTN